MSVRARPQSQKEQENADKCIWQMSPGIISLMPSALCDFINEQRLTPALAPRFTFCINPHLRNHIATCMGPETSNRNLYTSVALQIVESFLEGNNGTFCSSYFLGTIMVYGATGAGKTYTMLGSEKKRQSLIEEEIKSEISCFDSPRKGGNSGLLFYSMEHIFASLDAESTTFIRCTYVEIYNDNVYDLLQGKSGLGNPLSVNEVESKEFVIRSAMEIPVRNLQELIKVVRKGERTISFIKHVGNRHYAESVMNHHSSRSHTIFQIKMQRLSSDNTLIKSQMVSTVNLCVEFCGSSGRRTLCGI